MLKSKSSTAFSFSYISLLLPFPLMWENNKQSDHCWCRGSLSLSLFLVQAPRMEIFSRLNSEKSCSSKRGRLLNVCSLENVPWSSASKTLCRNAGCLSSWDGGGHPRPVRNPWCRISVFFFLSICKVSALGRRVCLELQESTESTICSWKCYS